MLREELSSEVQRGSSSTLHWCFVKSFHRRFREAHLQLYIDASWRAFIGGSERLIFNSTLMLREELSSEVQRGSSSTLHWCFVKSFHRRFREAHLQLYIDASWRAFIGGSERLIFNSTLMLREELSSVVQRGSSSTLHWCFVKSFHRRFREAHLQLYIDASWRAFIGGSERLIFNSTLMLREELSSEVQRGSSSTLHWCFVKSFHRRFREAHLQL